MNPEEIAKRKEIGQFWHDQFLPFNPGRDFVVLFGKHGNDSSMALLQLDGGDEINTGGIIPVTSDGKEIPILVKSKG